MKLYYHPASTSSRIVTFFAADHEMELELELVDMLSGENRGPAFTAVNPNQLLPVLEDGDFRLTETVAILRYLAAAIDSPTHPAELRARVRVDEALSWCQGQLGRDFACGYVYPQLYGDHFGPTAGAAESLAWHKQRSERWLDVLDRHMLGDRPFVCGDAITLADYALAPEISLGEFVGFELTRWPQVARWMERMKARPGWGEANAAFYGMLSAMQDQRRKSA